ncbi:hypothetical protein AAG570_002786 [Ranatra chinensis]|uniref:Peptidase S1 domain-containing protein n=1 Tax=Ranatra chinensis TaxID=642074 RepID=A0ABD0Y4X1_9HEMI
MGSVGYKDNPTRWLCGCSLISERYVLTAAHCTDGGGPALYVRLGELDVDSEWDDARPVIMRVSKRINHPGYVSNIGYNDIALMQLERDATFNAYVRPACLPVTWEIPDQTAIATGWGHTTYGEWYAGKQSNDLRKVRLKLVSTERCQSVYGSAPKIPQGLKNESMLCAGEEEGKDTCQSDSGGPLQTPLKKPYCMYNIVGVTSFGKACGSAAPSVYTRVSYFVPWIESIVWP